MVAYGAAPDELFVSLYKTSLALYSVCALSRLTSRLYGQVVAATLRRPYHHDPDPIPSRTRPYPEPST